MVDDRNPASYGRELARQLRDLRKQAGHGIGDLTHEVELSPSRIGSTETVAPAACLAEARDLALPDQVLIRLLEVAKHG